MCNLIIAWLIIYVQYITYSFSVWHIKPASHTHTHRYYFLSKCQRIWWISTDEFFLIPVESSEYLPSHYYNQTLVKKFIHHNTPLLEIYSVICQNCFTFVKIIWSCFSSYFSNFQNCLSGKNISGNITAGSYVKQDFS